MYKTNVIDRAGVNGLSIDGVDERESTMMDPWTIDGIVGCTVSGHAVIVMSLWTR